MNNFVVGLVAGTPAGAALLSRILAGRFVDRRGAKPAMLLGLSASVFGGLFIAPGEKHWHGAAPTTAAVRVSNADALDWR